MEDLKTLDFGMPMDRLGRAAVEGEYPDELIAPLHTLVSDIVAHQRSGPVSVYICSADTESDLRNYFAFALAKSLGAHIADAVLIDLDFLAVGMSGIVPHRDGLGFLDLLLYGSSLGAVMQRAKGDVTVVGAGSFPVGKKSPFVMDAFRNSLRYLLNSSSCVVFCGPALDDEDNVHPIVGEVTLPVLVRYGRRVRAGIPDPLEDKLSTYKASKLWSVRVVEPTGRERPAERGGADRDDVSADLEEVLRGAPAREEEDTESGVAPPETDEMDRQASPGRRGEVVAPPEREAPAQAKPPPAMPTHPVDESPRQAGATDTPEGEIRGSAPTMAGRDDSSPPAWKEEAGKTADYRFGERRTSSFFPKAITAVVAVTLIAFLVWWLYVTRSFREPTDNAPPPTSQTDAATPAQTQTPDDDGVSGNVATTADSNRSNPTAGASAEPSPEQGNVGASTAEGTADEPPQTTKEEAPPSAHPGPQSAPGKITVVDGISDYAGSYLVHVSSFRRLENARRDAETFRSDDYGLIIAPVYLGEKGTWYRVYAGPAANAAEAQELKIKLDENPRVKFTRIVRVSG